MDPVTLVISAIGYIVSSRINAATAAVLKAAELDYYRTLEDNEFYRLAVNLSQKYPRYDYPTWILLLKALSYYRVDYPLPPAEYDPSLQAPEQESVDYSLCDQNIYYDGYNLGDRVIIPDLRSDRNIRENIDNGASLEDAYAIASAPHKPVLPPLAIQPCLLEVYREKIMNPSTGRLEFAYPQPTCRGFLNCFQEYQNGKSDWYWRTKEIDRRMRIAPGLWTPSYYEQQIIKSKFAAHHDIYAAYQEAGAGAIIPQFPGAMDFISAALINVANANLYRVIKSAHQIYKLYYLDPATTPPDPTSPPPTSEPPKQTSKVFSEVWLPEIVVGLLIYLIFQE